MGNNAKRFFILIVLYLCSSIINKGKSQEPTLWLMNGKKITIQSYLIDSADNQNRQIFYVNSKGKQKKVYTDEVFSFTGSDSSEVYFYRAQPEFGETLSIFQMKDYLNGLYDSKSHRVSSWLMVGGFASGLAGAFIPKLELELGESTMQLPIGILVPVTYVGLSGVFAPNADKLKDKTPISNPTDNYLMGYEEGVQKKIIKNSIISAGVGLLAGFIVVLAVN